MTRRVALSIAVAAAIAIMPSVHAYLPLGALATSGIVPARWSTLPVRYFVTNRDVPGVTATQLQGALQQGFSAWSHVATAMPSATFVGFTTAEPVGGDNQVTIGFQSRPELDRTLGSTSFLTDSSTGAILEADIFLNSAFAWSTSGAAGAYDVQSIGTHEIGHLFGLGHSMLGETTLQADGGRTVLGKSAVMFPIAYPAANQLDRTLDPDDIAGISVIYPAVGNAQKLGSIGGKVTLNGAGVFGAHVQAFNQKTGAIVAAFSLTAEGAFTISALVPGVYVVRAEPLDDADVSSFFDTSATVNADFKPAYYEKLVTVPAGGQGVSIEIRVQHK